MRLFFSILLLVLFISCSSESLEEDSIVKKHFSESEIVFLDSILTFFDSEVISQTPSSEIIQSYQELFQILKDSINSDSPSIALKLDSQKLKQLLSELPESLKTENLV